MRPYFLLFLLFIPNTLPQSSTTSTPDCSFIGDSHTFAPGYTYNGECCSTDSVEYLDQNYPGWRQNESNLQNYLMELNNKGYCTVSSTTTVGTTTVPTTVTSTTAATTTVPLNCFWLDQTVTLYFSGTYNGECCNNESVVYLNSTYGINWIDGPWKSTYITSLKNSGVCPATTSSAPVTSTSTPATSTSSSTASSTTLALNITSSSFTTTAPLSTTANESFTTTTSTTGSPSTTTTHSTTSSTGFNCYWLDTPFTWSNYIYDGTCCNPESVNYLNEVNGTDWQTASNSSRRVYIAALRNNGICPVNVTTSTTVTTTGKGLKKT
ncbi:hypothetical protein CAEBREN_32661 [Caenorhabditis brenneri]|uniref:Uncharacterized protein n=1 Tax=Caenorhabditis brenneri TaxID=135651 RepID=G0NNY7_CAEBE|nr:hypothetical protein CAEBREN_32661 [Caenorhabditis brenneri]